MTTPHMLALDAALAEVEVPEPDPPRWAGQLAGVARQLRVAMRAHCGILPPSAGILPGGGHTLRCHERVLGIMRAGGLSDSRSVAGLHLLWLIVNSISVEESQDRGGSMVAAELSPVAGQYLASFPMDRFPNLVAVARELAEPDHDERFDLLLGIFIDGLSSGRDPSRAVRGSDL